MRKKVLGILFSLFGVCTPVQGMQWARGFFNAAKRYSTPSRVVNGAAVMAIAGRLLYDGVCIKRSAVSCPEASAKVGNFVRDTVQQYGMSAADVQRLSVGASPPLCGFYSNGFLHRINVPSPIIEFDVVQQGESSEALPSKFDKHQNDLGELSRKERLDYYQFVIGHEAFHLLDGHNKKRFLLDAASRFACYGAAALGACYMPISMRLPVVATAGLIASTKRIFASGMLGRYQERKADEWAMRHSDLGTLRARAKAFRAHHADTVEGLMRAGLLNRYCLPRYRRDEKFREKVWRKFDPIHPSPLTRALRIEAEIARRTKSLWKPSNA